MRVCTCIMSRGGVRANQRALQACVCDCEGARSESVVNVTGCDNVFRMEAEMRVVEAARKRLEDQCDELMFQVPRAHQALGLRFKVLGLGFSLATCSWFRCRVLIRLAFCFLVSLSLQGHP